RPDAVGGDGPLAAETSLGLPGDVTHARTQLDGDPGEQAGVVRLQQGERRNLHELGVVRCGDAPRGAFDLPARGRLEAETLASNGLPIACRHGSALATATRATDPCENHRGPQERLFASESP